MKWTAALRALKKWLATVRPSETAMQTEIENSVFSFAAYAEKYRVMVAGVGALLVLGGASIVIVSHVQADKPWLQVYQDGKYIGLVPDKSNITATMHRIADGYHIHYRTVPIHTKVSSSYNWKRVASFPTSAAEIQVDNTAVLDTTSVAAAQNILENVKQSLSAHPAHAKQVSNAFVGNVRVTEVTVGVSDVVKPQAATQLLLHPTLHNLSGRSSQPSLHTVSDAQSFGRSSSQAQAPADKPMLSVQSTASVTKTVNVKYSVKYVKDNYLATGVAKVVHKGHDGRARERISETFLNGKLVSSKVVNKTIVQKPTTEVVHRGVNSGVATGKWVWPTNGYTITSPFGWRILFGRREFHPGIDIGVPTGTPIYATNDGTVISAGWNNGGYGNWVEIDNGHGITTVFGHMSKVVAHDGERVAKGQIIGYSGQTGEATGPHLHYEVRVNGTAVPPMKYT